MGRRMGRAKSLWTSAEPRTAIAGVRLSPAVAADLNRLQQVVEDDPVRGVHVAAALDETQPTRTARSSIRGLWSVTSNGRPIAVAQSRRGLSFAFARNAEPLDERAVAALASFVKRSISGSEVLFGPERPIRQIVQYFGRTTSRGPRAIEIRRQRLLAAPRLMAPPVDPPQEVWLRHAESQDLPWLLRAHAAMCREDLGVDQVSRNPTGYRDYFRELILKNSSVIGLVKDRPVFKAEYPVQSDSTSLVEGVYTEPDMRGRGIASWAVRSIAIRAATEGRSAALYVNRRNERARAVYSRIGFRPVCDWLTVLMSRTSLRSSPLEL